MRPSDNDAVLCEASSSIKDQPDPASLSPCWTLHQKKRHGVFMLPGQFVSKTIRIVIPSCLRLSDCPYTLASLKWENWRERTKRERMVSIWDCKMLDWFGGPVRWSKMWWGIAHSIGLERSLDWATSRTMPGFHLGTQWSRGDPGTEEEKNSVGSTDTYICWSLVMGMAP